MRRATQFTIVSDYGPKPPPVPPPVARALAQVAVHDVSASLYHCTSAFRIPRRRLRDDLLLLPLAGRGTVLLDGQPLPLAPRRAVYGVRGSWLSAETDPAHPLVVALIAHRADVAGGVAVAVAVGLPSMLRLPPGGAIEALAQACCREDAQRNAGHRAALDAQTTLLILALVRSQAGALAAPASGSAAGLARLAPALTLMGQDLALPLTIRELALACNLSAPQFRRVFHATLGMKPVAYLHRLRLAEARRLLDQGGYGMAEIAERIGYRSTTCLDRLFRQHLGRAPRALRRR